MSILVFDSGIGGLSVLREARMLLHEHPFIYVGDDAGFPYGDWEAQALTQRICTLFEALIRHYQPSLAIVACNTASTLIMPALRSRFSLPFVGIVPAIKPAAERTASGMISVLATPGTVKRSYTQDLIRQFASHCEVNLVGATRLAKLAEQHMQGHDIDSAVLQSQIAPCFVEREGRRTDIITLGCTHYPFLVNEMRKLAPWPVDWLDPAEAVARHARSLLDSMETKMEREPSIETARHTCSSDQRPMVAAQDLAIMTSQNPPRAIRRLLSGFGLQLESLTLPAIESIEG